MRRILKWRRWYWILLIAMVGGGYWYYRRHRSLQQNQPFIATAPVERTTVTLTVSASGTIQPYKIVDVKSKAAGKVIEMAVDVGDVVRKGQLICRIDPTDILTTVNQGEADLAAALARVQQALISLEMEKQSTPAQIAEARQALEAARARVAQARTALEAQEAQARAQVRRAQEAVISARARYLQAKAQAENQPALTKAAIEQAEANYRRAQETLKQLKEAIVPQQRAQAQAAYDMAQAQLENAERNWNRLTALLEKGFVPQSQVDQAKAQYESAKAEFAAASERLRTLEAELEARIREAEGQVAQAKANLDSALANQIQDRIRQQEVEAAEAALRQAEADLEAAKAQELLVEQRRAEWKAAQAALAQAHAAYQRALVTARQVQLRQADIATARAQVQRASAQLRNARVQLSDTVIVAPRDGVILEKLVEEGTVISSGMSAFAQGTTIVRLADMSRVFVDAEVAEADIANVWPGQSADVTVDALPNDIFEGKVIRVDPRTTEEQNVVYVHVWVEILDPDQRLKPGMSATCQFHVEKEDNVIAVPNEAVKEDENGRYYVEIMENKNPNGKPVRRYVEIGLQGTSMTTIKKGLRVGEEVITTYAMPEAIQAPEAAQARSRNPMAGMRGLMGR
ncbi:MAG: efflux RND transporter periplasmic adaptor subunit [Armatimonadetes bacterium]|nr:efflux RND transporter periplasmic adaptor subunit [Armatimonadota bacterium]MDW8121316.1 efflux RND transporter periplasmic adaptor subunit [Armatimonadota bacterium]